MKKLIAFLLAFAPIGSYAEGFSIEYGPVLAAVIPCDTYALVFRQELNDKWEGLLILHGEKICQTIQTGHEVESNLGGGVLRTFGNRFQVGVGAALWEHDSFFFGDAFGERSDIQLTALLMARWNFSKHWKIEWLHASTGGATLTNKGMNTFLVGYKF